MGFVVRRISQLEYIVAAPRHILDGCDLAMYDINRSCITQDPLHVTAGPFMSPYGHDLLFAIARTSSPIDIARWQLPIPFMPPPPKAHVHYTTWNIERCTLQAASGRIVRTDCSVCFNWETGKRFVMERQAARRTGYAPHYIVQGLPAAAFGWSGSPIISTEGELIGMLVATANSDDVDDGHPYTAIVSAGDIRRNLDTVFG
jgi:hypothetical protein